MQSVSSIYSYHARCLRFSFLPASHYFARKSDNEIKLKKNSVASSEIGPTTAVLVSNHRIRAYVYKTGIRYPIPSVIDMNENNPNTDDLTEFV